MGLDRGGVLAAVQAAGPARNDTCACGREGPVHTINPSNADSAAAGVNATWNEACARKGQGRDAPLSTPGQPDCRGVVLQGPPQQLRQLTLILEAQDVALCESASAPLAGAVAPGAGTLAPAGGAACTRREWRPSKVFPLP